MEAFDARRPAVLEPKPGLCSKYPNAEIINVVAAGPERNVLVIYRVPYVPPATTA